MSDYDEYNIEDNGYQGNGNGNNGNNGGGNLKIVLELWVDRINIQ